MRLHITALKAWKPEEGLDTLHAAWTRTWRNQGGFTLVELIVSLVLTSVMFSAMMVVFQTQNRISTYEMDVMESQQNARMGMTVMGTDIMQAGYFVDHFNRQPVWIDAAPYQLIFNANLSDGFVAMHRDSAVPLHDGTLYRPGDYTAAPQEENLPAILNRYLNESETIRLSLDRTYDGVVTSEDVQPGAVNPNLFSLSKEINGNPPAVLAYNVRGPMAYPDGTMPPPLFRYWGTFTTPYQLELWGDTDGSGDLSAGEIAALTAVPVANLPDIRQVDITIIVETNRPDNKYAGPGSTESDPYPYRSYVLRRRIRARNVGVEGFDLVLCGEPPASPVNPIGFDEPYDRGNSIRIEWQSSPDEYSGEKDVQYYTIYRWISGNEPEVVGQVQAMGVDTTHTFEDDGDVDNFNAPIDNTGYYYYIAAWDCAPQESAPSATIGPIMSLPNGPGPPVIEDAWDTPCDIGGDISVLFSASPQDDGTGSGVDKYNIFRGTTADTSIITKILVDSLVADGSSVYEYHDNDPNWAASPPVDGTPYYYIVRAEQGGVESENSNEYGAVWSGAALSAARITSVDDKPADDGTALIINWRRSPSEDCSPAPNKYELHRRVKGTSTWNLVTEITVAFTDYYQYEDDNGGAGLINGTTYEYVVVVRTSGQAEDSNIVEGIPKDNPPINPPTNVIADDIPCESDGDIKVSWNRSPDDGGGAYTCDEYWVYRKYEGGIYSMIAYIVADGSATYTWVDSDSTNPGNPPVLGTTYWYKITAYDVSTVSESDFSNEDDALSDGNPGAPEITAAYDTYSEANREIRIEFSRSADDGGCSDSVTKYYIYATTTPGSYGTEIGTLNADNSDTYIYEHNLMTPAGPPLEGLTYYYMIRAYDAVNIIFSQDSNEFGPVEPHGANCDCCPIFVDDMEGGNLGWTHGGTRDDFELGSPHGKSSDPSLAYSGSNVWGNDLGTASRDGQYRSRADSYLISPTLDLSAFEEGYVIMSYMRWLSVERSSADQAEVRVNGGEGWTTVWMNIQGDNTVDTYWRLQYVDLSQWGVLGSTNVRVAFTLTTNNSTQFGGWNIDDVEICYTAPNPCNYFLYVGDSIAENQGNNLFFDITNGAENPVDLLGLHIGWSAEGSLLASIRTQGGGPGLVWSASPPEAPVIEALFSTVVPFDVNETIRFKLTYQPGQMRGSALTLRFITACGVSTEVVIMVPE